MPLLARDLRKEASVNIRPARTSHANELIQFNIYLMKFRCINKLKKNKEQKDSGCKNEKGRKKKTKTKKKKEEEEEEEKEAGTKRFLL